jgi:hypothetical protein
MIYVPNLMKTGLGIQKLMDGVGGKHADSKAIL